ncbi:MAG: hypothetical protein ACXAC5_02335 [Promethearchaeota archaeon]|jgi:hypothetical protein
MISEDEARAADARRKLKRAEAKKLARCKTCPNDVSANWFTQCPDCIAQNITIEDHEAAEITLDRVLAGSCQNCGKTEGCTCVYIAPDNPLGTVVGFQNA